MASSPDQDIGRDSSFKIEGRVDAHDLVAGDKKTQIETQYVVQNAVFSQPIFDSGGNVEILHLPSLFMHRPVIDEAREALLLYGTCILLGPTGVGKTTTAISLVKSVSLKFVWRDAQRTGLDREDPQSELLIQDDICEENIDAEDTSMYFIDRKLIAITTSPNVASRILSRRGLANTIAPIIEVSSFTNQESISFLDKALGDRLSDEDKKSIAISLLGSPIALQAVPDLLLGTKAGRHKSTWLNRFLSRFSSLRQRKPLKLFLPQTGELNTNDVAVLLLSRWIEQLKSPKSANILSVLCRTSMLGMTLPALAFVAGLSQRYVERQLSSAIEKGFIRRSRHHRFPDLELLVPHDILRMHFLRAEPSITDRIRSENYLDYLKVCSVNDPALQIDAAMVGLQNSFWSPAGTPSDFALRFRRFAEMLNNTLESGDIPQAQRERIVGLFLSRARSEQFVDCSRVISLGQSITYLPPNMLLATFVWRGALSSDCWGRAASIRAATQHWRALSHCDTGVAHLEEWLKLYVSTSDRPWLDPFSHEPESETAAAMDLDLAAVLGGLCALGASNIVADRLYESWIGRGRIHTPLTIAHHVVAVGLVDAKQVRALKNFVESYWRELPDEPHKFLVQEYIESKGIKLWREPARRMTESAYALTAARAAHSGSFYCFVKDRAPKSIHCI